MLCSLALVASVAGAAPLADLWPYEVKRLPDGAAEYAFDLSLLKVGKGPSDARAAHGDEQVAAFLKALPRQVKVRVAAGAPLLMSSARGLEAAPLAPGLAAVPDGELANGDPLGRTAATRFRAPLDPDEPKLLPSVEVVLWRVRALEDATLAAEELDLEPRRADFWAKVGEKALARLKTAQGDAKEGASALLARLAVALACREKPALPAWVRGDADLAAAAEAELQRVVALPEVRVVTPPFSWRPELSCAAVRARVLALPFPQTRAGTAAVLTFLELLARDKALDAEWARQRRRRDAFLGPAAERALAWREQAKGDPAKALDDLSAFVDGLPEAEREPPGLLALPVTPFARFVRELSGVERRELFDELAAAVQDGRLAPATAADAPWPLLREGWLASLVAERPADPVALNAGWDDRMLGVFAALQLAHHEGRGDSRERQSEEVERADLVVRLNAPPALELEPAAVTYAAAAVALDRLAATLTAEGLAGLSPLMLDGARPGPAAAEAKRFAEVLRGLAKLATPAAAPAGKDVVEARRFLAGWRADPWLRADPRQAAVSAVAAGAERVHSAIIGATRRELAVTFAAPTKGELVGAPSGFVVNTEAEQRYLVPVLVTARATAAPARAALDAAALRKLIDAAGRDPVKIEGDLGAALK